MTQAPIPAGGAVEAGEAKPRLPWRWTEHWSGEWGEVELCGLYAKVRDCDGDFTWWAVRKGKGGPVLAEGERNDTNHFFGSVADAEAALRKVIAERLQEIRAARALPLTSPEDRT